MALLTAPTTDGTPDIIQTGMYDVLHRRTTVTPDQWQGVWDRVDMELIHYSDEPLTEVGSECQDLEDFDAPYGR